jgi:hypothetical protein
LLLSAYVPGSGFSLIIRVTFGTEEMNTTKTLEKLRGPHEQSQKIEAIRRQIFF